MRYSNDNDNVYSWTFSVYLPIKPAEIKSPMTAILGSVHGKHTSQTMWTFKAAEYS